MGTHSAEWMFHQLINKLESASGSKIRLKSNNPAAQAPCHWGCLTGCRWKSRKWLRWRGVCWYLDFRVNKISNIRMTPLTTKIMTDMMVVTAGKAWISQQLGHINELAMIYWFIEWQREKEKTEEEEFLIFLVIKHYCTHSWRSGWT